MVTDLYSGLLAELGKSLGIEGLHPDAQNTCLISFANGVEVYIEPYQKGDFMLISASLGEISPGRYRQDVFREALKCNGMSNPLYGTFAYSEQSHQLILFGLLSYKELNGERIAAFLTPFLEKAFSWKELLKRGDVPLSNAVSTKHVRERPLGFFGLRP